MNKRPEWILPDLKKAQVRTKNTIERIDSFIIPENAKFIGNGKNIIFLHMAVRQTKETLKH